MNDRPVKPALAAQLSALVDEARFGNAAFQPVIATAERLAASAGAAQSESWIVAQEALTTAIAARSPTANAQGDIDAIGASALQNQGGIAPNDLRAIDGAADEVAQSPAIKPTGLTRSKRGSGFNLKPLTWRRANLSRPSNR